MKLGRFVEISLIYRRFRIIIIGLIIITIIIIIIIIIIKVGLRLGLALCTPHECHCGSPVDAHGLSMTWSLEVLPQLELP